ncbi:SDR family NAD(P)-dependent oxidoreductase, partial [Kitasatospora sp. NPDC057500]|uniref:SDR family NAD(P)-dependent oxidoreductase n=1 Tax=Kitasatospora sp. NPDC057500 TaxID=3346151 RepID=UPI0036D0CBB1
TTPIHWPTILNTPTHHLDLPTYPFQHQHYWLREAARTGDASSIGLHSAEHPMLGAMTVLADTDGYLFTGHLSRETHPWLADHAVHGAVVLPGTALTEFALHAAHQSGCAQVRELTLSAPLIVPEHGGVALQITVGPSDEGGNRPLTVYARPADAAPADPWTTHAEGVLGTGAQVPPSDLTVWPPEGAEAVAITTLYQDLADIGLTYGPLFQSLRRVWRRGEDTFAEVELPEPDDESAEFGIHPAVLDAALHAMVQSGSVERAVVPFAWRGVTLHAAGASAVRVRLRRLGPESVGVSLADRTGAAVLEAESLTVRPISGGAVADGSAGSLYQVDWAEVSAPTGTATSWAVLGDRELAEALGVPVHPDLAALAEDVPDAVLLPCAPRVGSAADLAAVVGQHLEVLQEWLAAPRFDGSRLVLLTRGAIAVRHSSEVTAPAQAALWGLARTAQTEQPGRIVVVDLDGAADSPAALLRALGTDEPQLAVREGRLYAPRLTRAGASAELLTPPADRAWTLEAVRKGTLDGLALVTAPAATRPLEPGQVRIAVRAAGVNFRDVLISLGMYPGDARPGGEGAGVVLEVGPGVSRPAPGDRVFGMFPGAFGPVAVADHRTLAPIPDGWSFAQAASVPVVFLTAYYALVDLAALQPGESFLVHAAAGGVGTAAVQLATHLGAEVFGTASPAKHPVLRAMGLADDHIASSRTLDFETAFRAATGGRGIDVVLNALTGEFLDASLRLLSADARFLEMGKADLRDPAGIPGYQAFDLVEAGPERIGQMLRELLALFERGVLTLPEISTWDVHRAPEAFRALSQARLVGKAVLLVPPAPDPDHTVLVTGGTGALGALVARHLVTEHGFRDLVLASRGGPAAPGAEQLVTELTAAGATVRVAACDVGEQEELSRLIDGIPNLTGVVHAAGVLADGVLEAQSPASLAEVMRPKADAAWHLHRLTRDRDLAFFTVFSSASGVLGSAGQANYAAANTFLDALAEYRHAAGLPATSLAWGLWEQSAGMGESLNQQDLRRISSGGVLPLRPADGLGLLDAALAERRPALVPMRLDLAALRARYAEEPAPAVLRAMVRGRRSAAGPQRSETVEERYAGLRVLPPADQWPAALDLLLTDVAAVLGHSSPGELVPDRSFKEMGFDSLTGVELRNRLRVATGLPLPSTLVFDHPTPALLARQLLDRIVPAAAGPLDRIRTSLDQLDADVAELAEGERERSEIVNRLQATLWKLTGAAPEEAGPSAEEQLDAASVDEVLDFIDREFGDLT